MFQENETLYRAVVSEIEKTAPQVEALFGFVDYSLRLSEMRRVFEDGAFAAPPMGHDLLNDLLQRQAQVEAHIEPLLPLHAYLDLLRRLRYFLDVESGRREESSEHAERRRQSRRNQVFHYIEWRRKRTEASQPKEADDTLGSMAHLAEALRHSRNAVAHGVDQASLPLVTEAEPDDADRRGGVGDRLAYAVREMMLSRREPEVKFSDLYRYLLGPTFPKLFADSPSESARIEAFRYHFLRSAEKYGLTYGRGGMVRLEGLAGAAAEREADEG